MKNLYRDSGLQLKTVSACFSLREKDASHTCKETL
jgi:hypothetical protein